MAPAAARGLDRQQPNRSQSKDRHVVADAHIAVPDCAEGYVGRVHTDRVDRRQVTQRKPAFCRHLVHLRHRPITEDAVAHTPTADLVTDSDHCAHHHVADRTEGRRGQIGVGARQKDTPDGIPALAGMGAVGHYLGFGAVFGRGEVNLDPHIVPGRLRQVGLDHLKVHPVTCDNLARHQWLLIELLMIFALTSSRAVYHPFFR